MSQITLAGCSPTPLASYLKAVGVLRLLSECHPETRAAWQGESFVLDTSVTEEQLQHFFLRDYRPTPVMAPWNGGSGFYFQERKSKEKDPQTGKKRRLGIFDQPTTATKAVASILESTSKRLSDYREALNLGKAVLSQAGLATPPDAGQPKDDLLRTLRALLPDDCLDWLDAAVLITDNSTQFPPLLGTGGNDGNLDFSSNFMQRLMEVIGTSPDTIPEPSHAWLQISLFGTVAAGLTHSNIGQFSPGQAGGPNASTGFEGDSVINPWDFVLMIEGSLTLASMAVRRNASDANRSLSFPFTATAIAAGSGSVGGDDSALARGELWMPIWDSWASYAEIRALFGEGRVTLGRKPARDALDFVRAIHRLGCNRGIRGFQRYGLLKRSGKAYLAASLGRVAVSDRPATPLFDDLDQGRWLESFRSFVREKNVANRFRSLSQRLENAIFRWSGEPASPRDVQTVLVLLGEIQSALARSTKARELVNPLPQLSEQWVHAANDQSAAFRITSALSGLRGTAQFPLPLRTQLFPSWSAGGASRRTAETDPFEGVRINSRSSGRLPQMLCGLLERRLWLTERFGIHDKPLQSASGATLEDVRSFLSSDNMDSTIARLLPGLSLCSIPRQDSEHGENDWAPAGYALMKLCFTPDSILRALGRLADANHLSLTTGTLSPLLSGHHPERAMLAARRRLHASGLDPLFSQSALPTLEGISPKRAAAAMLIPLTFGAYSRLVRTVLKPGNSANLSPAVLNDYERNRQ